MKIFKCGETLEKQQLNPITKARDLWDSAKTKEGVYSQLRSPDRYILAISGAAIGTCRVVLVVTDDYIVPAWKSGWDNVDVVLHPDKKVCLEIK
jgi:hypothetical protein